MVTEPNLQYRLQKRRKEEVSLLSGRGQAVVMLFVFVLPPIITRCTFGIPTGRSGILISAVLSVFLAFLKEL